MFDLFMDEFGISDMENLLKKAVNSEVTDNILSTMSKKGDLSATEVAFLENLSKGTLTTKVTTSVSPQKLVCLANITALMYEEPAVKTVWAQGLGLEEIGDATSEGFLSNIISVFIDAESNAVIVAFEGTPYLQAGFFRGIFGWLQDLLSAQLVPFYYPCEAEEPGLCTDLKNKYPDAQVYRGFVPEQKKEVVDERFDEAEALMDKAIATLKAQGNEDKPKLIITGHSLGGAMTKNALVQVLLRGKDKDYSSVESYGFAPPVTGNPEYIQMTEDLLNATGAELFMVINQYDYVPYLPPFLNFSHGNKTIYFDHDRRELRQISTLTQPFENQPRNIFMPPLGYHSVKGQYLPLSRSALEGWSTKLREDPGWNATTYGCSQLCGIGQCGLFACDDTCYGML